jgi:hypothetical protein
MMERRGEERKRRSTKQSKNWGIQPRCSLEQRSEAVSRHDLLGRGLPSKMLPPDALEVWSLTILWVIFIIYRYSIA